MTTDACRICETAAAEIGEMCRECLIERACRAVGCPGIDRPFMCGWRTAGAACGHSLHRDQWAGEIERAEIAGGADIDQHD